MKKPIEWTYKQLALAVYASVYGIDDLGLPLSEILRLAGLSHDQWITRQTIDFPAQEGTSRSERRIDRWFEDYIRLKQMPRPDLKDLCLRYLSNLRDRKG